MAGAAPPQMLRGLDFVMQLNLAGPRSFLLQAEDELEAFMSEPGTAPAGGLAAKQEAPAGSIAAKQEEMEEEEGQTAREGGTAPSGGPRQLVFPPLARNFEELLVLTAQRHGLLARPLEERGISSSRGRRMAVMEPTGGSAREELPRLSCAEFLRAQRLPGDPPPQPSAAPGPGGRLHRLRMRRWAVAAAAAGTGTGGNGGVGKEEAGQPPAEEDEETLRAALDAAFRREAEEAGNGRRRRDDSASGSDTGSKKPSGAMKRGRGFDGGEEALETQRTRHDYQRFGPRAAGRLYLRDNLARAPWPTVRLRKLPRPNVFWRPEWRVGPDEGDMAERGARGGILSWAVEPTSVVAGEGFEVSLRSGPGPSLAEAEAEAKAAESKGASTEPAAADDVNPQRDEDDFVLSFRRGERAWHFTAGRRGRKAGGAQKVIADPPGGGRSRQMFWVACTECRADGKHYVVVGTVPGILTEHFFVAKVGRAEPLSHAGFSYLPHPSEAAFGKSQSQEPPPLSVESITVYPHGLTGDLPFISLRFVEQRPAAGAEEDDVLARAALPASEGEAALELALRRSALPAADADAKRFAAWCRPALRECGLPVPPDEEQERARRAEKRARLRTTVRPVLQNPSEAPSSWEPAPAEMPHFGPLEETLRHAPAAWAAAIAKAELEEEPVKEAKEEEED